MAEDTSNAQGSALTTPQTQARVALIGRAGAGKTALARALFGEQLQPTTIGSGVRYQDAAIPLVVDDLPGWTHGDERSMSALVAALEAQRAANPPLVAIWYALDASSARVTDYEMHVIEQLAQRQPVLVVLTRSDLVDADALEAMQVAVEQADIPNFQAVVAVAADPLPALGIAPFGIDDLVELTALAIEQAPSEPTTQPTARPAAQPADRQQARQAPDREQPDQATLRSQRETPREQFTREQSYATGGAGQTFAAPESGGDQSGAMVALVIAVSLALALLLLWRRLSNSAPTEE